MHTLIYMHSQYSNVMLSLIFIFLDLSLLAVTGSQCTKNPLATKAYSVSFMGQLSSPILTAGCVVERLILPFGGLTGPSTAGNG